MEKQDRSAIALAILTTNFDGNERQGKPVRQADSSRTEPVGGGQETVAVLRAWTERNQ